MTRSWRILGLFLPALLAASGCQSQASPTASRAPINEATNVLILADMGEAEQPCTCGEVIRAVRAAAARGIKTREVDSRNRQEKAKVAKDYGILVTPTVLFLDDRGTESTRVEGESRPALDRVRANLAEIAKK